MSPPLLLGLGTIALLFGGLLALFPLQSLHVMLSLFGVASLLVGLILLAGAVRMAGSGHPAFLIALIPGICALVLGVIVFLNPGLILAFAALILGFAFLAGGILAAGAGMFREAPPFRRVFSLAAGCLLAALGLLVLLHPVGAAEISIRLAGLLMVAGGIILLAMGITGRPERDPLENPEFRVIEER